ncbi:hypothetical protein ETB97_007908 [Aspergillus alliaceus]|uniref:Uncharacterized protein n=1 Tax=Petromyces alliaceus TaxID=209559 RepID=A0A8H6E9G7_PETAA|nr:hypothetical protein ETB97_007908 [Aspergillus burnettii]
MFSSKNMSDRSDNPDDEWLALGNAPEATHYGYSAGCYICGRRFNLGHDIGGSARVKPDKAGICDAEELEDLRFFKRKTRGYIYRMSGPSVESPGSDRPASASIIRTLTEVMMVKVKVVVDGIISGPLGQL